MDETSNDPTTKRPFQLAFGIIAGGVLGFTVGAALSFYVVRLAGSILIGRDFHQMAWFICPPLSLWGGFRGARLGCAVYFERPRLFAWTFVPLSICFVGLSMTIHLLRTTDRPRHFEIEIRGTPGTAYSGTASADGAIRQLKGTVPDSFQFDALQLDIAVAPDMQNEKNEIAVDAWSDGESVCKNPTNAAGVYLSLKAVGYSERLGGTSRRWSRLSPEEAKLLLENHSLPRRAGL